MITHWIQDLLPYIIWQVDKIKIVAEIMAKIQSQHHTRGKAEEPETKLPTSKLPTSAGSSKKQESSRKTSISALLTMPKLLTVWITINCGKFFKRWEYQTTIPASWEICMLVKKQQVELDMEQETGSKLGKEYVKAI